jgi:uncharacterized protein (TIGR03435 family)
VISAAFLLEWTFRSSLLIGAGALLLRAFRVTDPSIRLAAWTAVLAGSLAVPALGAVLPPLSLPSVKLSIPLLPATASPVTIATPEVHETFTAAIRTVTATDSTAPHSPSIGVLRPATEHDQRMSWPMRIYVVGVFTSILRMLAGLALSMRLRRSSARTGAATRGVEIRESDRITTPLTLGIVRPFIMLPSDWREWDSATRNAVLAHERAHAGRRDSALQLLSLVHRCILWHTPLSWWLHRQIVQCAEDASDDAAIAATGDRVTYAEILLRFMQRSVGRGTAVGMPMARHGNPAQRIDRILDETGISQGIRRRSVAAIAAIAVPLAGIVAAAQARPEFEVADVRVSTPRQDGRNVILEGGGAVRGGRFEIYNATMVDLIRTAYRLEAVAVLDGPSWLAADRYDVIAKAQDDTPTATLSLMLQRLLAERFQLKIRRDMRPLPAWVLSRASTTPRLRRASGSDEPGCRILDDNERLACRSVTMDEFAARLREGRLTTLPVVNATSLEGAWDFDLRYTIPGGIFGVAENGAILDVVDKQLGLKLQREAVPQPVVIVESVNRSPTPNVPDLAELLPPERLEFEVAAIRPCEKVDLFSQRSSPSGQVATGCQPLSMLVAQAWNLCTYVQIAPNQVQGLCNFDIPGAPSWLTTKRFYISAKAPFAIGYLDTDVKYRTLLRNLLVDRFKIEARYEDRLTEVNTLTAIKPRLRRADTSRRTACTSNGAMRGVPTVLTCQNVTMAQLAEHLSRVPFVGRVVDETGIEGAWDVTLTFGGATPRAPATAGAASPPDPSGAVPLRQAIEQQLGLKMDRARRPVPALVVDHIEENPTEN